MKLTFALLALAAGLVLSALAGPEHLIKQKAKDLRDQNNASQGVTPTTPGVPVRPTPTTAVVATPVATPGPQPITRFQTELASIKTNAPVTPDKKQKLAGCIVAMAQGAAKPSHAAAEALASEFIVACSEKTLSSGARGRLALDLDGLLNPARYPQAKPQAIVDDVQAVFQAAGLPKGRAAAISAATKALALEVQKF